MFQSKFMKNLIVLIVRLCLKLMPVKFKRIIFGSPLVINEVINAVSVELNSIKLFVEQINSSNRLQNLAENYMATISVGSENEYSRNLWIKEKLRGLKPGMHLLDAGAGEMKYKKYCAHLNYKSQDFSEYSGQGDGVGLQMGAWNVEGIDIVSDITKIPVADSSFDVILCTEVLEHIPRPELAIKEFARIIKSGGTIITTAPFASLTHFAPYHYSSGFNSYWYEEIYRSHGLSIVEMIASGNYFEYLAQEIRRSQSVSEKYAQKTGVSSFARMQILKEVAQSSAADRNSAELMNFGYFVVARKD